MGVPNSEAQYRFMGPCPTVDTRRFFEMGWDLITRGDAGTRQHIITKLGSKTGLIMVKALTDLMVDGRIKDTAVSIFRERTLPFYRVISHPDVLSSLILETPLDSIKLSLWPQWPACSCYVPIHSNSYKWTCANSSSPR